MNAVKTGPKILMEIDKENKLGSDCDLSAD